MYNLINIWTNFNQRIYVISLPFCFSKLVYTIRYAFRKSQLSRNSWYFEYLELNAIVYATLIEYVQVPDIADSFSVSLIVSIQLYCACSNITITNYRFALPLYNFLHLSDIAIY